MQTRNLGTLAVSVVGLGCNNFGGRLDQEHTTQVIDAALDAGINFFDTADVYGGTRSEELVGRALGARRRSVLVATKFGIPLDAERKGGARPEYIRRAVEDSLRRLGSDYIDLYQLHREPERGVLAECERSALGFLPYFPLASGLLSGKYAPGAAPPPATSRLADARAPLGTRFRSERNVAIAEELARFAESRGHSLLELAFSWLLQRPAVSSVIAGATSPDQIRANAAAARWQLSVDELAEVDRLAPPE